MTNKTKIVLDADVIIHFMKGEHFSSLLNTFPEYQYLILDVVRTELAKNKSTLMFVDRIAHAYSNRIQEITFNPSGEMQKEYALLLKTCGKGESACMTYCYYNNDVLGSSNLKDIANYCNEHNITYLTTIDFLYYAYKRKVMTIDECNKFIQKVNAEGSKLPIVDISQYTCKVVI
jgi:hypothetical protein